MVWRRHVSTQRSHCGRSDYSKTERLAVENWISTYLPLPFLVRVLISPMLSNVLAPRSPHFTLRSRGKHLYKFLQREESTRLAYYSGSRLAYKPALFEIDIMLCIDGSEKACTHQTYLQCRPIVIIFGVPAYPSATRTSNAAFRYSKKASGENVPVVE